MSDIKNTSQTTEKGLNKIIELDSKRIRGMKMKLEISNKKSVLTASVISIVAMVTFVNQQIVSRNETVQSRNIASVNLIEKNNYKFQWQRDLSEKLAREKRMVASVGESPTAINQIRFGLLEGKYTVVLNGESIKEIEFAQTNDDRPKFIDVEKMILENIASFNPEAASIKLNQEEIVNSQKEVIYTLESSDKKVVSRAYVVYDNYGRFRNLKISQ